MSSLSSPHRSTPKTPMSPADAVSAVEKNSTLALQVSMPYIPRDLVARRRKALRKGSESKEEHTRLQACVYMLAVSNHLQFPMRTCASAMMLYHRFHLSYSIADMSYQDVTLSCLFVASKMEDTNKKLRDIIASGYHIRHPGRGELGVFEEQKRRIVGFERMVLEVVSFDFRQCHAFKYVIKIAQSIRWSLDEAHTAWMTAVDLYRTYAPLKVEPQALACAAIIISSNLHDRQLPDLSRFVRSRDRINAAMDEVLDLYIHHRQFTSLGALMPQRDFITVRIELHKRLGLSPNEAKDYSAQVEKEREMDVQSFHVSKVGEKGTLRFFLDYDADRRAEEIKRLKSKNVSLSMAE